MKKTLLTNLKYIAFGLVVAFGASALAQWTPPVAPAPSSNMPVPLHSGPSQVKLGGLSLGTLGVFGAASLEQDVYFKGVVRGGTPADADSTVRFGDAIAGTVANTAITGAVNAQDYIQSGSVANAENKTLCANETGTIIFCTGQPSSSTKRFHSRTSQAFTAWFSGIPEMSVADVYSFMSMDNHSNILENTLPGVTTNRMDNPYPRTWFPGTFNWPNFNPPIGEILTVEEAGSYTVKFNSSGTIAGHLSEKGWMNFSVNFFVNVNKDPIPMITPSGVQSCAFPFSANQPEPRLGPYSQFIVCNGGDNAARTDLQIPYSFNFTRTFTLNPGDKIYAYATVRGAARDKPSFLGNRDFTDYRVTIAPSVTEIEITYAP